MKDTVPTTDGLETPVLLLVFNRPGCSRRLLTALEKVRPRKLLVSADGPRNEAEAALCRETRALFDSLDWDCIVQTHFSEKNLGGPLACSAGISWALEQEDRCIILEDDCLPDPSFFQFCERMLERYQDDGQVMHVSGSNFIGHARPATYDYHFSRYATAWGWATWRRAWQHFDLHLSKWPAFEQSSLPGELFPDPAERAHWKHFFSRQYHGEALHWDYAWMFACMSRRGRCVVPNRNLVSNIGWGSDGTHTRNPHDYLSMLPTTPMATGSLRHPPDIDYDDLADAQTFRARFQRFRASPTRRAWRKMRTGVEGLVMNLLRMLPESLQQGLRGLLRSAHAFLNLQAGRLLRLVKRPPLPANVDGEIYLHLGCGPVNHPNFINVDMQPYPHVHYLQRIDRLHRFQDQSVDLIYACHCLEHFPHAALQAVLQEWFRLLKPSGILRLSVPDFDQIVAMYQHAGGDSACIVKPLMGGQNNPLDFHYNAFSEPMLRRELLAAGFRDVRRWDPGSTPLTTFNDWSNRKLMVQNTEFPVSLNIEAQRG